MRGRILNWFAYISVVSDLNHMITVPLDSLDQRLPFIHQSLFFICSRQEARLQIISPWLSMFLTYTCAIFKITKNHKTLHQFCGSLYHSRTTTSVSVDKFLDQEGLTDLLQDEEDSDEEDVCPGGQNFWNPRRCKARQSAEAGTRQFKATFPHLCQLIIVWFTVPSFLHLHTFWPHTIHSLPQ